jgi:hypothetical protein
MTGRCLFPTGKGTVPVEKDSAIDKVMNKTEEQKLEHIIKRMSADRSEDAPAEVIKYARHLFRTRAASTQPSVLRKVLASLQMDLLPNTAAFGERSFAGSEARQMLFDAGENAVDLRINAVGKKMHIRGQVMGGGFENAEAVLTYGDLNIHVKVDENGAFTFAGLESGDYGLSIQGTETEILIEKFSL